MSNTAPSFEHLENLTTPFGLFEHALGSAPRVEHGYCVDDAARALIVTAREPNADDRVARLAHNYLEFVLAAQWPDGRLHNRRGVSGAWADKPSTDDHWGRALWALSVAASSKDTSVSDRARQGACISLRSRSRAPRAMAYAAIGAGNLLRADPTDLPARRLLADAAEVIPTRTTNSEWPWPEERLTYANAVLPEAMIVLGACLGEEKRLRDGVFLLNWLVEQQTVDGHLSLVASGGREFGDQAPGFAQQPIEAAALAEAAGTAFEVTGDLQWIAVIDLCLAWFTGSNDLGVMMCHPGTGAGFDGLEREGASTNQGAESTLAWLSTQQLARISLPVSTR